ncbi:hypothetical protein STANM309S_02200 [Streptomyces tanashiensis]
MPAQEDLGVPLGEGAGRADLTPLGGVVHQELRLVDLLLQSAVDLIQMFLLDTDLTVSDRVHGFLRGHLRPPSHVHWAAVERTPQGGTV